MEDAFSTESQIATVDQLTHQLKTTVTRFQEEPTPENFAQIITALREFGLSGKELWSQAVSYARQNPVRVALYAGLLFYALKGISEPTHSPAKTARPTDDELH